MSIPEKIREKIAGGALPTHEATKVFVGKGTGRICDGCDLAITDIESEFDAVDGRVLRFHRACFVIWDVERTQYA